MEEWDIIECVDASNDASVTVGMKYAFDSVRLGGSVVVVKTDNNFCSEHFSEEYAKFRFVRRPS